MNDAFTIAVILTIAIFAYLFSDGGPGTPKRVRAEVRR